MASAEVPALRRAKVRADGSLEGIDHVAGQPATAGNEDAVALMAHLLGLLVTFIGEPLTLKLVRAASPETAPDE